MNEVKKYRETVRALFPIFGPHEKRFFSDFNRNLEEYLNTLPNSGFSDLEKEFGAPSVIISEYLSNVDAYYLRKQLRRSKYIRISCISAIALLITALIIWGVFNYKTYCDFQRALPVIEETTIQVTE